MKLKANGDQTHVSVGDGTYMVDSHGFVDVPGEIVEELKSHGFKVPTAEELAAVEEYESQEQEVNKKNKKK